MQKAISLNTEKGSKSYKENSKHYFARTWRNKLADLPNVDHVTHFPF